MEWLLGFAIIVLAVIVTVLVIAKILNKPDIPYRSLGSLWLTFGALIFVLSLGYLLAAGLLYRLLVDQVPIAALLLTPLAPASSFTWLQLGGAIFALFCIWIGAALLTLRPWARTIGIAFHIAMGACLAGLTLLVYARLSTPGLLSSVLPDFAPEFVGLFGGILSLGLFIAGYQLSSPIAMEAFSGPLPLSPPTATVLCPTCNAPLDLATGLCPIDDAPLVQPVRAKLIDLQHNNKEYFVGLNKTTLIGRNPGVDVQVNDPSVSGEHAMIEAVNGAFYLHALKDLNGTYVNDPDTRVRDVQLKSKDTIILGKAQFDFVIE